MKSLDSMMKWEAQELPNSNFVIFSGDEKIKYGAPHPSDNRAAWRRHVSSRPGKYRELLIQSHMALDMESPQSVHQGTLPMCVEENID